MSRLWWGLSLCAALAGCSTLDSMNPFSSTVDPKLKPADLVTIDKPSATLKVLWQANVGNAGEFVFSPAVVGDSVFAASREGALFRFDGGKQAWKIAVGQPLSGGVGADSKWVVVGTSKGEVLTFDAANGAPKWKARVSSEILAAPVVTDTLVIVRSGDSQIHAFDIADGKRRWVYQRPTPPLSLRSSVGVTPAPGGVLAGFPGGKLVVVSQSNGAAVWESTVAYPKGSTELERVADVTSAPAIDGRVICASAFQGRVSCFDGPSGNSLWARDISSAAGVDIDGGTVYVSDDRGAVLAFDRANGASQWKQDKLARRGLSRPIALSGKVAVGDVQGYVHLIRREDGAFAARIATDGSSIVADPKRYGNGFIVQTRNGGLFAIGIE